MGIDPLLGYGHSLAFIYFPLLFYFISRPLAECVLRCPSPVGTNVAVPCSTGSPRAVRPSDHLLPGQSPRSDPPPPHRSGPPRVFRAMLPRTARFRSPPDLVAVHFPSRFSILLSTRQPPGPSASDALALPQYIQLNACQPIPPISVTTAFNPEKKL